MGWLCGQLAGLQLQICNVQRLLMLLQYETHDMCEQLYMPQLMACLC